MKSILHRIALMILLSVLTAAMVVGQNTYRVNRGSVAGYKIDKPAGKVSYSWQVFHDKDLVSVTGTDKAELITMGAERENEIKVKWIQSGDYYLQVLVTTASGCINRKAWHFRVDENHPIARINGPSKRIVANCNTEGIGLDASASTGDGLIYKWTPSVYLDIPSISKPKFYPGLTTRYFLTVTDSHGLSDTSSVLIVVADPPKAITDKNVFVDTPEAGILLNGSKSTGSGLRYLWSSKKGNILKGETESKATVRGIGTYYLQVTDSLGCSNRDSVVVGLYIQAINDSTEITANESVTINVLRNDFPIGALDPSSLTIITPPLHGIASLAGDSLVIYQPETSYAGNDEFVYQVCDYSGMCDNAKVLVLVNDLPFFIPEAFSPNGDGLNDLFVIKGLEKFRRAQIEIFNRWGNVVYRSENYGTGPDRDGYWNGVAASGLRIESGPVPSGTYYYILKINGQRNISGAIYLDR